jgi:acyl-CoA synthetase (NDP forming)
MRNPFLAPQSIVVLGASESPGNLGARVIEYARKYGYRGRIHVVNPRRDTVMGLACYPSPSALPEVPELAILAVSAAAAEDAVRSCIEAGISRGILWAAGFAEVGGDGVARQASLAELCRQHGFALCGPNTLGIIDMHTPLAATFATPLQKVDRFVPGSIAVVSQSGGTAIGLVGQVQQAGFGLRCMISTGNEAVLRFPDYLRMLAEDEATRVVAAYLEGVQDGADFLDALAKLREAGKPLVIVKAGAAEASARAAQAHTGALTGAFRVWRAVLEEHGAILVRSQRELLDVSLLLAGGMKPRGRKVAVVSAVPESAGVAAELLRRQGLEVSPTADVVLYEDALGLGTPPAVLEDLARRHREGVVQAVAALEAPSELRARLAQDGLYVAPTPARAAEALGRVLGAPRARPVARPAPLDFDWSLAVPDARAGQVVSEHDCHRVLAAGGLNVARGTLAHSAAEAAAALVALGGTVAMKGISPAVTHRAAAGLLRLGIADAQGARAAFQSLVDRAANLGVPFEGAYVQRMEEGGVEVIVAAFRDPMFGVMVTCGAGGTATELLDDVALARAPLDEDGARALIGKLRLVQALGDNAPDAAPLAGFIAHFSRLAAAIPWPAFELEVNPVKWRASAAVAVDGLLLITAV